MDSRKNRKHRKRNTVIGKRLDRRAFLAGTGGLAVSLPFLEAMLPVGAEAQTGGKPRYVLTVQGISQSRDGSVGSPNFEPVRTWGLENDVTFVQGLMVDRSGPAPLQNKGFHPAVYSPLFAGVGCPANGANLQSITSDHVVAQAWGSDVLHISTQTRPAGARLGYNGGGRGTISHTGAARGGLFDAVESPFAVWDRLFSGLPTSPSTPTPAPTTPTTPTGPTAAERNAQRGLSVLDVARTRAQSLRGVVSAADWTRMDEHFVAIRELELKLEDLLNNPTGNGGSGTGAGGGGGSGGTNGCTVPTMPTDPAQGAQWSNETLRGEIFADMLPLAFACDRAQVVNWMITWMQCHMPSTFITGVSEDLHWMTHNDPTDGRNRQVHQAEYTAWQVNQYARLVNNLKNTTDGTTGAPLFDSTVAVMVFESVAGHGFGGDGMTALIAGRPSTLNLGTAVQGEHPAQLLSTAMHSVGVSQFLGNVPGLVPGLLR